MRSSTRVLAVLVIALEVLAVLEVGLLLAMVAQTAKSQSITVTSGSYPSVYSMPPIALQPLYHVGLPWASFLAPELALVGNWTAATPVMPQGSSMLFYGQALLLSVPQGVVANLSALWHVTSTVEGNGNIYYAVAYQDTPETVVLPQPSLVWGNSTIYSDYGANVFYLTQLYTYESASTVGATKGWATATPPGADIAASDQVNSAHVANGYSQSVLSIVLTNPGTLTLAPSWYYSLYMENPLVFYAYVYPEYIALWAIPAFSYKELWGEPWNGQPLYTMYTLKNPLVANAQTYSQSLSGPPGDTIEGPMVDTYSILHISANYMPYSGMNPYPVPLAVAKVTPYFAVIGTNYSVSAPGITQACFPVATTEGPTVSCNPPATPMRPTVLFVPIGIYQGKQAPTLWGTGVYAFSPPDLPNSTVELYPLDIEEVGPNTYWVLVGGLGVTHLYLLQVQVTPNQYTYSASNGTVTDVPSLTVSMLYEINFGGPGGYGSPTSAVMNGYDALVGTANGYVVLVDLLSKKVLGYTQVSDQPLFTYTNLDPYDRPVAVVPFFPYDVNESDVIQAFDVEAQGWKYITEAVTASSGSWNYWNNVTLNGLEALVNAMAANSLREDYLVDWTLQSQAFSLGNVPYAYVIPHVNDLAGVYDPELLYINGTLYNVVLTGALSKYNGPVAGIQAYGSAYSDLQVGSPVSYPIPVNSNYTYVLTGVTLTVTKVQVLPGQTVHLDLYPWVQDGQLSYMLNYGLVNDSVLYTYYASVQNLTTAGITYPSFYTNYLATEIADVGLANIADHFIVTMADVKMHPPPYFYTSSAWVATSLTIPTNAPMPLYSTIYATTGIQAYTDVVPAQNNNALGIISSTVQLGAEQELYAGALGAIANGITAFYGTSTIGLSGASAAAVAAAPVLETTAEVSAYVGVAIIVWGAVDYALAKWAGFGQAYTQTWLVTAPVFYDPATGKYFTAVELVLPASEASNVGHYEQIIGSYLEAQGFSGVYFQVVYPFYTWQQLNASIASGAYQPRVNITQLAQAVASQYGIPLNQMVLTGVKVIIITRIHAKETFWQYVNGPVDFLVAQVIGSTYLDVEGNTTAITYTTPSAIASFLQSAQVDGFTAAFTPTQGGAVASVSLTPTDSLTIQLGQGLAGYADTLIQFNGYLIWPIYNHSNVWYGAAKYNWVPMYLGSSVLADGLPVPIVAGNYTEVQGATYQSPVIDLTGTKQSGLYFYSGQLADPFAYIAPGAVIAASFTGNASFLRPYAVPLGNVTVSDLPQFLGFRLVNPMSTAQRVRLLGVIQGLNGTAKATVLNATVYIPPKAALNYYIPSAALAGYAASKGSVINLTAVVYGTYSWNSTATLVWAPTLNLSATLEAPKPLATPTVKAYNALNGSVITATVTVKPGAPTITVLGNATLANSTGSGSLVQGLVYVGAHASNFRAVNYTTTVVYNGSYLYVPVIPSTLSYVLPWAYGQGPSNSSAQYEWLTVILEASDGGPANGTVYVYNGSKLIRSVPTGATGTVYLLLPKGTYTVGGKIYNPRNSSQTEVLSNETVALTSDSLAVLAAPNWREPYWNDVIALVRATGPSIVAGGVNFTVPVTIYAYTNYAPVSPTLNYTSAIGGGSATLGLSNGSNRLVVPLTFSSEANQTVVVTLKLTNINNATPVNTTWLTAYFSFRVLPVVYLSGMIYWKDIGPQHSPFILPGDTLFISVIALNPVAAGSLELTIGESLAIQYPYLASYPNVPVRTLATFAKTVTQPMNVVGPRCYTNVTMTIPWTDKVVVTANVTALNYTLVVPWYGNATIDIDPIANVSLLTTLGTLISGKAVPLTFKIMSNVMPGQGYVWVNLYDNTTNHYLVTLLTPLAPVKTLTAYATVTNSKWFGLIPVPVEYHTLTLKLTGYTSLPYSQVIKVLVFSESWVVFFLVLLAILILILLAVGAISAMTHAIRARAYRFVRRAEDSGNRYVTTLRWVRSSGVGEARHYVRRVSEEEDRRKRRYVK